MVIWVRTFYVLLLVGALRVDSVLAGPTTNLTLNSKIQRIEVFGRPEIFESYEAIGPDALYKIASHRVSLEPSSSAWKVRTLLSIVQNARPVDLEEKVALADLDYRWGCIFYGADSSKEHELYVDVSGTLGVIDGRVYKFSTWLSLWFYLVAGGPCPRMLVILVICGVSLLMIGILLLWRRRSLKLRANRADAGQ